jgi:hypothetical protein
MKLIVDPQLRFADLAARVDAEGWQQAPDPTAPPPIIPGEPESADFKRGNAQLHDYFAQFVAAIAGTPSGGPSRSGRAGLRVAT